jgi:hypothetical protein
MGQDEGAEVDAVKGEQDLEHGDGGRAEEMTSPMRWVDGIW